ncbi:(Fe-S)-binding protein [Saccharicrinis sp. FJH62]|uniref:(Fe-S)-binding protein n=1 Tax=Saccharicrinis sp. FJH62 TaxID=3344657 RepID=UPI0035D499C1
MEVDLFVPCFIDQLYPDTAFNTIKVLEKAGCTVNYNPEQTCCGQPFYNSGHWDKSRDLALKFMRDFPGSNPIISPSGSCTGYVKNHYKRLFKDDPEQLNNCDNLSPRVFELTDFLVNHLKFTDFNAEFNHKVTFHDSCHALRDYGIKDEPRLLLSKVKGLELIEMADTDVCCGFGGTFSVKFEPVSSAMAEMKVSNALDTGAEYIIATEASCMMNMQGYIKKHNLPIQTIHIADILADRL